MKSKRLKIYYKKRMRKMFTEYFNKHLPKFLFLINFGSSSKTVLDIILIK